MGLREDLEKASEEAVDETDAECNGDIAKKVSKGAPIQDSQGVAGEAAK